MTPMQPPTSRSRYPRTRRGRGRAPQMRLHRLGTRETPKGPVQADPARCPRQLMDQGEEAEEAAEEAGAGVREDAQGAAPH